MPLLMRSLFLVLFVAMFGPAGTEQTTQRSGQSRTPLAELMKAAGNLRATMHGYHFFYDNALAHFRDTPGLRLLEIGVNEGDSLLLWLQYFSQLAPDGVQGLECAGPGCSRVDVREKIAVACRRRQIHGCERIRIFFGDQSDGSFLRKVVEEGAGLQPDDARQDWSRGGWDVVIDDGGHIPRDQLLTFCAIFPFVRPGGLYVVEDIETSYWDGPGAGVYGRPLEGAGLGKEPPGNFVEVMKQLVDVINRGWFFSNEYTVLGAHIDHSIASISFHGGLVAIQKRAAEHVTYPLQHFHERDRAQFVDLVAVQRRIEWLREVRIAERGRKQEEEDKCLRDPLECVWTRAPSSSPNDVVPGGQGRSIVAMSNGTPRTDAKVRGTGDSHQSDPQLSGSFVVKVLPGERGSSGGGLPGVLATPSIRMRVSG